jgi:lipopolysaccharide/colanic/teichoic acid biosynthesis glycosyltransferase
LLSSGKTNRNVAGKRTNSEFSLSSSVERLASVVALAMLAPLLTVIAAAIILENGRPVLFRQTRLGKDGRPFQILKFRSMRSSLRGVRITASTDARITRVGSFLRRYKLDELPQLWNVARGDMSLVGPRPELPEFVDLSVPIWRRVLSVKPGITDVTTLAYRNEQELLARVADPEKHYREVILPAKLDLNAQYIRKRSVLLDIRVLLLTALFSISPKMADARRALRLVSDECGI